MRSIGWIVCTLGLAVVVGAEPGPELRDAQKRGDLAQIQDTVRNLRRARKLDLYALMMDLDAKRLGGFVSAPAIATRLLMRTEPMEVEELKDAIEVLAAHARNKKAGKWARVMHAYGLAVLAQAEDRIEEAAKRMDAALQKMADEGWAPPAFVAATTLAVLESGRKNGRGAAAALLALEPMLGKGAPSEVVQEYRQLYSKRFSAGAPDEVVEAHEKLMAPHSGSTRVAAAGGAGGAGLPGGGPPKSKVGAALKKFPRSKALVSATRKDDGTFEIRQGFDKKFRGEHKVQGGTRYHADGGVTLGFWGHAVCLYMIDPIGRNGQPGESSMYPSEVHAYYFIARGETWSVNKRGVVTIK